MGKITIEYNLPDEQAELDSAMNGFNRGIAIDRIANEIFRPHRKHGYPNVRLQELLEKNEDVGEAIELLEERFFAILQEEEVTRLE